MEKFQPIDWILLIFLILVFFKRCWELWLEHKYPLTNKLTRKEWEAIEKKEQRNGAKTKDTRS